MHPYATGDVVGIGFTQQKLFYTLNGLLIVTIDFEAFGQSELKVDRLFPVIALRGPLTSVKIVQDLS